MINRMHLLLVVIIVGMVVSTTVTMLIPTEPRTILITIVASLAAMTATAVLVRFIR